LQGLLPASAPLAARNDAVRLAKQDCAAGGWATLDCPAIAEYLSLVRVPPLMSRSCLLSQCFSLFLVILYSLLSPSSFALFVNLFF